MQTITSSSESDDVEARETEREYGARLRRKSRELRDASRVVSAEARSLTIRAAEAVRGAEAAGRRAGEVGASYADERPGARDLELPYP